MDHFVLKILTIFLILTEAYTNSTYVSVIFYPFWSSSTTGINETSIERQSYHHCSK